MKFFSVVMILFTGLIDLYSQDNLQYIDREITLIENRLLKKGEQFQLSNLQKDDLIAVFSEKYIRLKKIKSQKTDKHDISKELIKLDREYEPRIAGLLTSDQRLIWQKSENKPRDKSSKQ